MAISWYATTRYLLGVELLNMRDRWRAMRDYGRVATSAAETLERFNSQVKEYEFTPDEVERVRNDLSAVIEAARAHSADALRGAMETFYKDVFAATHRTFAKNQERYEAGEIRWSTLPPQVLIEGGEEIPPEYRHLIWWIKDPLPEYSLMTLPAVVPGRRYSVEDIAKKLEEGVKAIHEDRNFRLFLETMSKFHDYSFGNQLLIMLQRPDATKVAGFVTWKELGRPVKFGEKGIAIQAPMFPAKDTLWERGDGTQWEVRRINRDWGIYLVRTAEGHQPMTLLGTFSNKWEAERQARGWGGRKVEVEEPLEDPSWFKVVYVFDISQTEGKPLPEFEVPVLTGEVNEELFARMTALTRAQGLEVSYESMPEQDPSIKGQYLPPNRIWVRPEEPRAQQLKTLLHEVAHYYSEGVFRIPRRDAETIAESAAFVVGAHYGFDTGVRSFPYVALWAKEEKVLKENLGAIKRVATTMLGELEKTPATVPQTEHPYVSKTREMKDTLERLRHTDPHRFYIWRASIKEAIQQREQGKTKLMPDFSLAELKEILEFSERLYAQAVPSFKSGEIVRYKGEKVRVSEQIGDRVNIFIPSRQELVWVKPEALERIEGEPTAVIPTEPRRPRPGKEELEFLPDSPEFLAQTIADIGYREKIDTAFQEAKRRASEHG